MFLGTDWTSTSINAVVTEDLFATFIDTAQLGNTYLANKLTGFMFVDGVLRVTIVVQGSSVAQGKLMFSFDPAPKLPTSAAVNNPVPACQLTRGMLVPNIQIDPSESKTYTIDLPPPTIWGVYSLAEAYSAGQTLGSYRMKQHVVNQLGSGTAIIPTIGVAIYLSLMPSKFSSQTTATNFTLTSALKTEKKEPVSSYFKKASNVVSWGAYIPEPRVSMAATIFSNFLGGAGSVLEWFGFSKPLQYYHDLSWVRSVNNWSRIDGDVTSEQLSLRNNNSVGICDSICPLLDFKDMVVSDLCQRRSLVQQFQFSSSDATGLLLSTIPVSPMLNRLTDDPAIVNGYELTPLSFVAFPYNFWRGDITYTFEFVSSVFHRATVGILYNPTGTVVAPYINAFPALQHWTVSINGHMETSITIPWKQIQHFLPLGVPSVTPSAANRNGLITVFLINPVTTNGSTDPIHVNVYCHSTNVKLGVIGNLNAFAPVTLTSAIKGPDDKLFYAKFFGEEPAHTTKELTSRMTEDLQISMSVTGAAPASFSFTVKPGISFPLAGITPYPSTGDFVVTWAKSLFDFVAMSYVGHRGSINYSIFPGNCYSSALARHEYFSSPTLPGLSSTATEESLFPASTANWGPFTTINGELNQSLDVTTPYYASGLFRPTYEYGRSVPTEMVDFHLQRRNQISDEHNRLLIPLFKSSGDDFLWVGYRGTPTCVYT